jgi:hypothetical protein
MTMKNLIAALTLGLSLALTGTAFAHTAKPKHGGVVREAGDLSFELVAKDDSVTIYVDDHGKPLATTGMAGKLTILNGKQTSEAALAPVGENRLEAKGVKVEKGARAVAVLTTPQKKTLTVRFNLK